MARSGAQGFTVHAGLSVHSYWKNVFKVDLPGMHRWHGLKPKLKCEPHLPTCLYVVWSKSINRLLLGAITHVKVQQQRLPR